MPRMLLSTGLIGLLLATIVVAQAKPDFTGTWMMDPTRSESAAQGANVSPETPVTLVIVQERTRLSVETQTQDGRRERLTYPYERPKDATEAVQTSGSDALDQTSMEWRGDQLITTAVYRVSWMAMKRIESRRLSADGREMTVETTLQVEHGYQGNAVNRPGYAVVKDVYTKTNR